MVGALCRAAQGGPDLLYDVMLKVALMIDATAQTYGLATFAQQSDGRPRLKWVEGLEESEIAEAERRVAEVLADESPSSRIAAGDRALCLILAAPTERREGVAIYGRCVRPLTGEQARELKILADVARLAHAHATLREEARQP
ncbi:MAG TPA: hypothetical protein VIP46_16265, partial [Pyrinomonadaceae bacterium]